MSNLYCLPTGKISYPNRREASAAARAVNGRKRSGNLEAFSCQRCGSWHIGRPRSGPERRP